MDISIAASAFATVVSLVGQFSSGRDDQKQRSIEEFSAWLDANNHSDVVRLIESNSKTVIGIKALLNQKIPDLTARLEKLDQMLAALSTGMEGFHDLAEGLKPGSTLSDQALSILSQVEARKAGTLTEFRQRGYFLILAGSGYIDLEEDGQRFLESDIEHLVSMRLLIPGSTTPGKRTWSITREASELARSTSIS